MRTIFTFLRNQRGSQGIEASGAALAAAIIVATLLDGAALVGSKAEQAYKCAAAVLRGGGGDCGSGSVANDGTAPPAFANLAGFVRGASDGAVDMTNAVFTTFADGGNLLAGDSQTTARYQQAVFFFTDAPTAQLAQLVQPAQHQTAPQGPDPNAAPQEAAGGAEAAPQEAVGSISGQTGPITHDDGMQVLRDNNIGIQSSSGRIGPRCRTCTSLEGMQRETINGLAQFTRDFRANTNCADCAVTVTGGTETGHSTRGTQTHGNGYKVDIRFTPDVDRYIMNFERAGTRRSDGAALYRDGNGTIYARESDHWDIQFAQ